MNLQSLTQTAKRVDELYRSNNDNQAGWTARNFTEGLVGDVGDLMKLLMAKDGLREIDSVDEKIKHELSDCLWSILMIANRLDIDMEKTFLASMTELEMRIAKNNSTLRRLS